jgi:hypothetical protein
MIPEATRFPESRINPKFMYHEGEMRRAFSILFVCLFALGPLAVLIDGDDASLPACCRRNGTHHCVMTDAMLARMVQAALSSPAFTSPGHCPQYSTHGNAAPSHALALARASKPVAGETREPLPRAPSDSHARNIHLRAPALRGPPALTLAS